MEMGAGKSHELFDVSVGQHTVCKIQQRIPSANTLSSHPLTLGNVFVAIHRLFTRPAVSCFCSIMGNSGARSDDGQGSKDCLSYLAWTVELPALHDRNL